MIYWAPLLHFYQPPTQVHWVLKKVCDESYRPLVGLFHSLAQARVTVNINAVLTEMLHEHCMSDVIDGIKELAVQGRIELTGSAKYHAILPLLPESEVLRQIVLNQQVNRRFFGKAYAPQGFFPPEMCYGASIAKTVIETGHRWIILGGVACPAEWPTEVVYKVSTNGQQLATFFRDDVLSNRISFKQTDARQFIEHLRGMGRAGRDTYVVTAMDAETFGHHIPRWEKLFLARVYQGIKPVAEGIAGPESGTDRGGTGSVTSRTEPADPPRGRADLRPPRRPAGADEIQAVTLSQLLELMSVGEAVEPRASSWSTSLDDIAANNPYPLWKSPDNVVHQLQWQHLKIALDLSRRALDAASNDRARGHADIARAALDSALHSDQFWWASKRPWWDVNMVYRGLEEQSEVVFNAYQAIRLSGLSLQETNEYYYKVLAARDLRGKISDMLFQD